MEKERVPFFEVNYNANCVIYPGKDLGYIANYLSGAEFLLSDDPLESGPFILKSLINQEGRSNKVYYLVGVVHHSKSDQVEPCYSVYGFYGPNGGKLKVNPIAERVLYLNADRAFSSMLKSKKKKGYVEAENISSDEGLLYIHCKLEGLSGEYVEAKGKEMRITEECLSLVDSLLEAM